MKSRIYFSLLLSCICFPVFAQLDSNDFVSTWDTRIDPCFFCGDRTLFIYTDTAAYNYNFDIDWNNDGIFDTLGVTESIRHNYPSGGIYTIRIRGTFPSIKFGEYTYGNSNSPQLYTANPFPGRLLSIDQWGNQAWKNLELAFTECKNLRINATDQPNLDSTTSLHGMFLNATKMNDPLNSWDVSTIEDMSYLFFSDTELASFDQALDQWDVSNVRTMKAMFHNSAFDQNIGNWNVSVTGDMSHMFANGSLFNQDIGNWNFSNVKSSHGMFQNNKYFNQDLSAWDVSNDTNLLAMFKHSSRFDQNLGDWTFAANAITDSLLSFTKISKTNYDSTLLGWAAQNSMRNHTIGVEYTQYCTGTIARDSLVARGWMINGDIWNCDTTHMVITLDTRGSISNFLNDSSLRIRVSPHFPANFDVDWNNDGVFDSLGVTSSIRHQYNAEGVYTIRIRGQYPSPKFGPNKLGWFRTKIVAFHQWGNTSLKDLDSTFYLAETYMATDEPILDSVQFASHLFYQTANIRSSLSNWDVSSINDMSSMFAYASEFNQDISNWDVSNVTNMNRMFELATKFDQPIGNWDVGNVTDMSSMFRYCNEFNQDISNWNVSKVKNMTAMFQRATYFNSPLANWDVSNVTQMKYMFNFASSFNQNINNWNVDSITDMGYLFAAASSFDQPLNSWNLSNVRNTEYMFWGAFSFNQDISNWDVSNVTDMEAMFDNARAFNQPLNNWNVSNVTNMHAMLIYAHSFDQPINQWDVSNVTDMSFMFYDAGSFDQNLGQWNISSLLSNGMDQMLSGTGLSIANYDSTLINWETSSYPSNMNLGAIGLVFCLADSARNNMINNGWSFIGDRIDSACILTNIKETTHQIGKEAEFLLYPNPSNGIVYMIYEGVDLHEPLFIYDQSGKLSKTVKLSKGHNTIHLNNLSNGFYYYRLKESSGKLILDR